MGIILRGLVVNMAMVASAICAAVAVSLFMYPTTASLSRSWLSRAILAGSSDDGIFSELLSSDFVLSKLIAVGLAIWCIPWAVHRSIVTSAQGKAARAAPDPESPAARATGLVVGMLLIALVLEAQQPVIRLATRSLGTPEGGMIGWNGLGAIAAAVVAIAIALAFTWRLLIGSLQRTAERRSWTATIQAAAGRTALWSLASALPLSLYGWYVVLVASALDGTDAGRTHPFGLVRAFDTTGVAWPIAGSVASVAAIVLWNSLIGPLSATILDRAWWRSQVFRMPGTASSIATVVLAMTAAWPGALLLEAIWGSDASPPAAACYLSLACVLGALTLLFSENATSLHSLYRDRLDEAFNYRSAEGRPLMLSDLKPAQPPVPGRRYPPKLIVNAAVNMQGSQRNRRARGADYFVFTHSRVGSDATGYAPTLNYEDAEPQVDLATAIAISGAAVSAAMGRASVPPLGPTLALLNIRLGFWLRNPRFARRRTAAEAAARWDWTLPHLLLEAFGLLTERLSKVYVTDGGHIDNLGMRELLRRRCGLVIVSDAEADPGMNFAALMDVQRFARIDLGVRIELPWRTIRDGALGRKAALAVGEDIVPTRRARAAVGIIHYPAIGRRPADKGVLLYVKAATVGTECDYVRDYERRFPAFPHEPTGDQFFSEEQFEAYRALGYSAAAEAMVMLNRTAVSADDRG